VISGFIAPGVQLTRTPQGIELYSPPFRAPGGALSLALFGVACLIPGLFAAFAVAPLAASGAAGMIAIWLMSAFILPFVAFGVLFLALAAYRLTNSLTGIVTASNVHTTRRILGIAVRERFIGHADIAALETVAARRYRWLRDDDALYDLVVRTRTRTDAAQAKAGAAGSGITVAESLRGEDVVERIRSEIAVATGLGHPA